MLLTLTSVSISKLFLSQESSDCTIDLGWKKVLQSYPQEFFRQEISTAMAEPTSVPGYGEISRRLALMLASVISSFKNSTYVSHDFGATQQDMNILATSLKSMASYKPRLLKTCCRTVLDRSMGSWRSSILAFLKDKKGNSTPTAETILNRSTY